MANMEDVSALGTAAVLRHQASGDRTGLKMLWSNLNVLSIALFASFVSHDWHQEIAPPSAEALEC